MDNDGLQNPNTRAQSEQTSAIVTQLAPHAKHADKKQESGPAIVTPTAKKWSSAVAALKTHINWGFVQVGLFIMAIVVVIGGFLYWGYMNGMESKSVTVGGYTYDFNFIRSAKFVQYSNGMRGYETDSDHGVIIGPVSGLPQLCGLKSDPYTTAFTVQINGATRPVCTARDSQDEQMFMLTFTAQNQYHEIIITYGYVQNASIDAKLLPLFESIRVSK